MKFLVCTRPSDQSELLGKMEDKRRVQSCSHSKDKRKSKLLLAVIFALSNKLLGQIVLNELLRTFAHLVGIWFVKCRLLTVVGCHASFSFCKGSVSLTQFPYRALEAAVVSVEFLTMLPEYLFLFMIFSFSCFLLLTFAEAKLPQEEGTS